MKIRNFTLGISLALKCFNYELRLNSGARIYIPQQSRGVLFSLK